MNALAISKARDRIDARLYIRSEPDSGSVVLPFVQLQPSSLVAAFLRSVSMENFK
jgi:hypothetical protein